jgi:hypothetical protein
VYVDRIADRLELRALVDGYADALDARDAERLAASFLPAGTITSFRPGRSEPFFELRGSEELKTLLERLARYQRTWHFVGNHLSSFHEDSATGRTSCMAHHLAEDEDGWFCRVAAVDYEDDYVLTAAGWRFSSRVIRRVWAERRPALYVP